MLPWGWHGMGGAGVWMHLSSYPPSSCPSSFLAPLVPLYTCVSMHIRAHMRAHTYTHTHAHTGRGTSQPTTAHSAPCMTGSYANWQLARDRSLCMATTPKLLVGAGSKGQIELHGNHIIIINIIIVIITLRMGTRPTVLQLGFPMECKSWLTAWSLPCPALHGRRPPRRCH